MYGAQYPAFSHCGARVLDPSVMHKFLSGGGRGLSTGGTEGSVNSISDPISDLEWRVGIFKTLDV